MAAVLEPQPLRDIDEWDDFVATRYKLGKSEEEFRNYKADANPTVTEFYRQNHRYQTLDFVLGKKREYGEPRHRKKHRPQRLAACRKPPVAPVPTKAP